MRILDELTDLVFPAQCLCCDRPGGIWCVACQPDGAPRLATPATGPPVYAAGEYADELRTVLIAYKERGRRQLVERLADYLADAVDCAARAGGPGHPVLVPVPSTRRAARMRGGDHVLRLARLVGRQHALPVLGAVRLAGPVRDSAGLSVEQRRRNLAGRMAAAPPPTGAYPILLDDIVTTGTTLAEAGRALTEAGWQPAAGAVIAATRLRRATAPQTSDASAPSGAAGPRTAATTGVELPSGSTGQNAQEALAFI